MTLHLAIGTPMYGGQCVAAYKASVMRLDRALRLDGGKLSTIDLGNESLIQRARNTIAWHFLQMDATHLLFCDADTGFRVEDVARMVAAAKPIIVGPCPMKAINWQRVARAVRTGVPAEQLHRYTGYFNVSHLEAAKGRTGSSEAPFEIKRGGTGFMLIERRVFETLASLVKEYANRSHGDAIPFNARVKNFFPVEVVGDDLLSEDFGFCELWRQAGGTIWAAPWCELTHVGTFEFTGVYKDCFAATEEKAAA